MCMLFLCRRLNHLAAGMTIALAVPSVLASENMPSSVRVFSDHAHPVTNNAANQVIWLDAPAQLEAQFTASLPKEAPDAALEVQQHLRQHPEFQHQLTAAYQGVVDAWNLGVTTLPAVVLDNRYVVYGEPDVAHAVARIAAYRSAHP
jgi:integrating conjugative element protein (TIGR03757 family)